MQLSVLQDRRDPTPSPPPERAGCPPPRAASTHGPGLTCCKVLQPGRERGGHPGGRSSRRWPHQRRRPRGLQPPELAGGLSPPSSDAEDGPPAWRRPLGEGGWAALRVVGRTGRSPRETLTFGLLCRDASCCERGCSGDWLLRTACWLRPRSRTAVQRREGEASVTAQYVGRVERSAQTTRARPDVLLLSPWPRGLSTAHKAANGPQGSAARQKREGPPR